MSEGPDIVGVYPPFPLVVPVRIQRDGAWQSVDFDTLTDAELEAFCEVHGGDPLTGWRWARTLAKHLARRAHP